MHQVIEWLNENERRAYPLYTAGGQLSHSVFGQTWTIPDNFLLDLLLTSRQSLAIDYAKLSEISFTSDNTVEVAFAVGDTEIARFEIQSPSSAIYPLYIRNTDGSLAVFGEGVKSFVNVCTSAVSLNLDILVEPSVCIQYSDRWLGVSSLGATIEKKTVVIPQGDDWTFPHEPLRPVENVSTPTRLTGHIKLLDGYNFDVNTTGGLINLDISFGLGLKMNCSTNFLQPQYLDCDEIISYINGISPDDAGIFTLNSSSDIVITAGKDLDNFDDLFNEQSNQHTLFFGFAQKSADLCKPINLP